ncbi:hypothetical protein BHE74_00006916 [Ensete ventricosum]|nr:hypothetical protein BHE74_00006916 [Ensete ventricosum]
MILRLENHDLSLLDICHVGATFLFTFFPLEVSETTIRLDYSVLLNNLCIVLPSQMRLLDCDTSPIQLVAHFSLLRTYPFHDEKKVSMLHGVEFRPPYDGQEHSILKPAMKTNQTRAVKPTASSQLAVQSMYKKLKDTNKHEHYVEHLVYIFVRDTTDTSEASSAHDVVVRNFRHHRCRCSKLSPSLLFSSVASSTTAAIV